MGHRSPFGNVHARGQACRLRVLPAAALGLSVLLAACGGGKGGTTADASAGTSGETPPLPWKPWHSAHANREKSCAPAATCAETTG